MKAGVYAQRDYEKEFNDNFWKFCKDEFEYTNAVEPKFSEQECFEYFKNIFKEKNKSRLFNWPSWLRSLPPASEEFNMECPTYREISKIIRKMKSRGSACPFDQISIIAFKRCPILRTRLWRIICQCWTEKSIPSVWKHAAAILIHKKDTAENPANFRPICLEPVLLKVLTSVLRNRTFNFVCSNGFIESEIQKGFWPGISGTIEHTELLSYIINHARIKQRSLIITLIDLKNAFGEVHHRLLRTVLAAHHIPEELICLIENLYTDFSISVVTKEFITKPIPVERGVLQGDCLSPLLFNLCVNSLIQSINDEKLKCLGYVNNVTMNPKHWFQFADDTAIISAHEQDNQLLCNVFSKWCTWADLNIRVDKCHTFGIKKQASKAIQYQPVIIISAKRVPPIENENSFNYLGKQFNFSMECESIKIELVCEFEEYLKKIDLFPINPFSKIRIIQDYVYSKIRWRLSIYDISETWIKQNIDHIISKYIRKWLQIPVSGNITHLKLPKSDLGIDFSSASDIHLQCKLSVRRILKSSKNSDIQHLYAVTSSKHIKSDELIEKASLNVTKKYELISKTNKFLKVQNTQQVWAHFTELKEQSVIVKHLVEACHKKILELWQEIVTKLPRNITCFARRALVLSLSNNSNLKRWNIRDSPSCDLCDKTQTQLHVFSYCKVSLQQKRYTWRHDSIMNTLLHHLRRVASEEIEIFADCPDCGLKCTSNLFENLRPDIVVRHKQDFYVIELTVPYETNWKIARRRKQDKYRDLRTQLLVPCEKFKVITLEITTLGFVTKNIRQFRRLCRSLSLQDNRIIKKCMEVALRATFYIFCKRNKINWTCPELLKFY